MVLSVGNILKGVLGGETHSWTYLGDFTVFQFKGYSKHTKLCKFQVTRQRDAIFQWNGWSVASDQKYIHSNKYPHTHIIS